MIDDLAVNEIHEVLRWGKTAIRNATPIPFRDLLCSIARQAHNAKLRGAAE